MAALRESYQHQLGHLTEELVRLTRWVEGAIEQSVTALKEHDLELARQVVNHDLRLNALRYLIEEEVYELIATQQPVASDLRRVISAISLATNLERMGDHAAGVAQLVLRLAEGPALAVPEELLEMGVQARGMLREALNAYLTQDAELARQVATEDDQLDALYQVSFHHLTERMAEDAGTITAATYLVWVGHNLERIGDRITNICERIIYIVSGELVELDRAATRRTPGQATFGEGAPPSLESGRANVENGSGQKA